MPHSTPTFESVKLVLSSRRGERIEVEATIDGLVYLDVEQGDTCAHNFATNWDNLPDDGKRNVQHFITAVASHLSLLGIS